MSATVDSAGPRRPLPPPLLFAVVVFVSAGLVFAVQPMVARMLLPRLGGSAAVWNTSLAFFQAALLIGYAYAHALQRLRSLRLQMGAHLAVLLIAAAVLPLQVTGLLGPPSVSAPVAWLFAVLVVSLGAPFAALSATTPLVQAWYARLHGGDAIPTSSMRPATSEASWRSWPIPSSWSLYSAWDPRGWAGLRAMACSSRWC